MSAWTEGVGLNHSQNDHWQEWRKAVERDGFNPSLALASERLRSLQWCNVETVERLMREASDEAVWPQHPREKES